MQQGKRTAELELPQELFGGNIAGLFDHLGLAATHVIGNRWRVHAATTNAGRPRDLLQVRTLAGPQRSTPQFDVQTIKMKISQGILVGHFLLYSISE